MYVYAQSLSFVQLLKNPRTVARQAPLSMEFPRQECWSGDFPGGAVDKKMPANAEDTGSIPGPGRFHMLRSN